MQTYDMISCDRDSIHAVGGEGPLVSYRHPISFQDAAAPFCRQVRMASYRRPLGVIAIDQHAASPLAFEALQHDGSRSKTCLRRHGIYLHYVAEQDHRLVQHRVNPGLGFGTFATLLPWQGEDWP
jgi:hypothetical protein